MSEDHEPKEFRLVEVKVPAEAMGPTGKSLDGYGVRNSVESN